MLFENNPLRVIKLKSLVYSTLEIKCGGKAALVKLTEDMLEKTGADEGDSEGFVNIPRSVEGVEVGVFFKDSVESLFGSITVVGFALVATALLLFFSDYASRPGRKSIFPENEYRNGISYWQAFAVGIGQAFAVVPGLSRSGTTISTGLICGVKREVMAQFSFLMVLVPILGETFLEIVGGEFGASSVGASALLLGFVSAFLSGLFACKVMIALVKKARLSWFALYCLLAAAAIFIFG
jgi:undecaprenyl-diphosphatase